MKESYTKTPIYCAWEHNGSDTLLHSTNFIGAYTRGESLDEAISKMTNEIVTYSKWTNSSVPMDIEVQISEEKSSSLRIRDADSDILFSTEKAPLNMHEYIKLKELALKSAEDFLLLYNSIADKNFPLSSPRQTFYGAVPNSAKEMYMHTRSVNSYYFAEIGIKADNDGTILECRKRGFELLERVPDFLSNKLFEGSYGEDWTLRKVIRRFIWHDRIHAKAMYRNALKALPTPPLNPFKF